MEFEVFTLKNGIRVVHSPRKDSIIAHLGVMLNVGSRDELEHEQGIAHFTEHCFFKGTKKRKIFHILNRLDSVGGELDAFTSKEETCLYASFIDRYYDRATELLADVLFNSTFPEKEIAKEREVIIDEIHSYQDNPYEQIYDDFEKLIFQHHPIGRSILGDEESVNRIGKKDILAFIQRTYAANRMTISSVGNISSKKLRTLLEKHFEQRALPAETKLERVPFSTYTPQQQEIKKDTNQAHLAIGLPAYDLKSEKRDALALLNNILGGPGMNNRLNLNIREKYGFTYHIESTYTTYSDSGVLFIYAGTDKKKIDKSKALIYKELDLLRKKKLGPLQLHAAKNQLIGQIAIGRENKCNQMLAYGKSLALKGKVDTIETIHKRIERITAAQLFEVANTLLDKSQFSELRYI
jgi:predicted Zn-dependent peptidase